MKEHQITAKAKPKPLSAHVHLPVGSDVSGVVTKKDKNERRLEAMLRSIKNNADLHSPAGYAAMELACKLSRQKIILILLIIFSSFSSYSIAGIQVKQGIPKMVQRSDLIIRGKVISTESQWKEDSRGRHIYTNVTVKILDKIKGKIKDDAFAFEVVGGTVDDITEIVSDTPVFEIDEDAIVFLAKHPRTSQQVTNGKILIYDGRVYRDDLEVTADSFIRDLKILEKTPGATTPLGEKYQTPAAKAADFPIITDISFDEELAVTNKQVAITGRNFGSTQGLSKVKFFNKSKQQKIQASIVSWSNTQIICTVPANISAGSSPVTVTTSEGTSSSYAFKVAQCFIYSGYKWPGTSPTVSYKINENTPDCYGEGAAVQRAADTWNNVGANFTFQYGGSCYSTGSSQNYINCITWGTTEDPWALAETTTWVLNYVTIVECDVVFNDWDYTWSTKTTPYSYEHDVESVALHEFGHWLSLDDLYGYDDSDKVMYYQLGSGVKKRELHPCDCDGICHIYPKVGCGCNQDPDLYDRGETYRSFSPTTIQGGENLSIHCDIRNGGTASSGPFVVKFYASTNTTISSSDHYIGQEGMSSISAGDWAHCDWSGTFDPSIPVGVYWVGWIIDADNNVSESNENNNIAYKQGYQLTVQEPLRPDLYDCEESYRSFSPTTILEGESLSISTRICNGDIAASGSFVVKFYASTNTTISSSSDYYIGQKSMSGISAGNWANCDWSGTFPPSIPAGVYWVGWIIDSNFDVSESDEDNNTAYKQGYQLTVVQPTLTVTSPEIGSWYDLGKTLPIAWDSEYTSGNVKIDLYKDGSFERIITSSTSDPCSYDWLIPTDGSLIGSDKYQVKVTDVSNLSCSALSSNFGIATPPEAHDGSATTTVDTPITITLQATDEGQPDALTYTIMSLPIHGDLNDPGSGWIESVPYTLVGYGNEVEYIPDTGYEGQDIFTFDANDGGVSPGGGDSEEATILIDVTACIFFDDFPSTTLDTTNWTETSGTPTVDSLAGNEPSPPYSLHLEAADSVTSRVVDLYECWSAKLNYYWQRASTESGDDLYVDYWDGNEWQTLQVLPGEADSDWEPNSVDLPADALHSEFRLRFQADCDSTSDEWYIDDVCIQCQSCIDPPVLHDELETTPGSCNTISWDPVADANEYFAECANDANFTDIVADSGWIADTNYEFCGLATGQIYWYHVKARAPFSLKTWLQTTQAEFQTDTLTDTRATADGDVVLAGGVGTPTVDTVGGTTSSLSSTSRGFFNGFLATTDTTLTQIEVYLGISASASIEFVVYEGGALFSDQYNRIHSSTLAGSGTGTKFYSSGPISVPLKAGTHYMIGSVRNGLATPYYISAHSSPTFATHTGWGEHTGLPSPSTLTEIHEAAYTFYHRYTTAQSTGGYDSPGSIVSTVIDLPADGNWDVVDYDVTTPADTELTIDVIDGLDESAILTDIGSGTDLSGITSTPIKLLANLSTTNPDNTPALHEWSVTYTDPALACESDWSNVEFSRQVPRIPGDLDTDGDVDMVDFAILCAQWLEEPGEPPADIAPPGGDGIVNSDDLVVVAANWLAGTGETMAVELNLDNTWMYQNLPGQTGCGLTATVSITDDPLNNTSYTYEWEIILPDDVTVAPIIIDGCGDSDPCCTFAAPGCDEPNGLSDSGQPLTVRVTVIGDDHGNTATAEALFCIALLGDANNDCVVNVADRSIINAFWRLGEAGPFTFRDCDLNCDSAVNVADRSIANAVWRGVLCRNRVSQCCPLR